MKNICLFLFLLISLTFSENNRSASREYGRLCTLIESCVRKQATLSTHLRSLCHGLADCKDIETRAHVNYQILYHSRELDMLVWQQEQLSRRIKAIMHESGIPDQQNILTLTAPSGRPYIGVKNVE